MYQIPYPSNKYFPKIYADNPDAGFTALTAKFDIHLLAMRADVLGLYRLKNPDSCPYWLLDELGYYVNAGITGYDSESVKRKKINVVIEGHKYRGTWPYDAKPKIDAIAGYDSELFYSYYADDWIMYGGTFVVSSDFYWATMGTDGIDMELGLSLVGIGTEVEIAGNIYIDCHKGVHTAVLTATQIASIVETLTYDIVPAYFRVYLGYIDASGVFTVYAGGTIE